MYELLGCPPTAETRMFAYNRLTMNILLVAATEAEIGPLLTDRRVTGRFAPLVTGAGVPATVYGLMRRLRSGKPDLIVNAGLAGSYSAAWPLGTVVRIASDCFADLGAEDGESFIHISEMDMGGRPPHGLRLLAGELSLPAPTLAALPVAQGVTVNTVRGNAASIRRMQERFHPDTETMEGAAVMYVAQQEDLPVVQVRALSNRVERRDKSRWKTGPAVKALNETLAAILLELTA